MSNGVVDIKGKSYKLVSKRVEEFREAFPASDGWGLTTDLLTCDSEQVIVKASIVSPDGKIVGTGYAQERWDASYINKTSAVENCETSAIGRALSAVGFAGDEYASANEVQHAVRQQSNGTSNRPPAKSNLEGLILGFIKQAPAAKLPETSGKIDSREKKGELSADEAKRCRLAVAKRAAELGAEPPKKPEHPKNAGELAFEPDNNPAFDAISL